MRACLPSSRIRSLGTRSRSDGTTRADDRSRRKGSRAPGLRLVSAPRNDNDFDLTTQCSRGLFPTALTATNRPGFAPCARRVAVPSIFELTKPAPRVAGLIRTAFRGAQSSSSPWAQTLRSPRLPRRQGRLVQWRATARQSSRTRGRGWGAASRRDYWAGGVSGGWASPDAALVSAVGCSGEAADIAVCSAEASTTA